MPIIETYLVYILDNDLNDSVFFNDSNFAKVGVIAVANALGAYDPMVDAAIAIVYIPRSGRPKFNNAKILSICVTPNIINDEINIGIEYLKISLKKSL